MGSNVAPLILPSRAGSHPSIEVHSVASSYAFGGSPTTVPKTSEIRWAPRQTRTDAASAASVPASWWVSTLLVGDADVVPEPVFEVDAGLFDDGLRAGGPGEETGEGEGV